MVGTGAPARPRTGTPTGTRGRVPLPEKRNTRRGNFGRDGRPRAALVGTGAPARPLPAPTHVIGPIGRCGAKLLANWISRKIHHFLRQRFFASDSVVEEIALPHNPLLLRDPGLDPWNYLCERYCLRLHDYQMDMIRHDNGRQWPKLTNRRIMLDCAEQLDSLISDQGSATADVTSVNSVFPAIDAKRDEEGCCSSVLGNGDRRSMGERFAIGQDGVIHGGDYVVV